MIKRKIYTILCVAVTVTLVILWAKSTKDVYANLQNAQEISNAEIERTLVEAIFRNVHEKTREVDTLFLHQNQALDAMTMFFHNMQAVALQEDSLQGKDVRSRFDRLLIEKQINAKTAVKIVSTGRLKNLTTYSGDTASMVMDEQARYIMNNKFGKIEYVVYVDFAWNTFWQIIFRHTFFGFITLVFFLGGMIVFVLKSRKSVRRNNNVVTTGKDIFQNEIKMPLFNEELKIEEKQIVFKGKNFKISPQSLQILQLFLDADRRLISKDKLKQIWIYNSDPIGGMTSAINRLNRYLAQIGCLYVIVTDELNKAYYKLDIREK